MSTPSQFRKKPVTISAIQWLGHNLEAVIAFTGKHSKFDEWFANWQDYANRVRADGDVFKVFTLEGTMAAQVGDWIIRGVKGEFYPCKPDIFDATYEPVTDAVATPDGAGQTTASLGYVPRTHRQDLEMSVAHAVAEAVGNRPGQGKDIGNAVRESLDALLGTSAPVLLGLPVIDPAQLGAGCGLVVRAAPPITQPVTEQELAAAAVAPRVSEDNLNGEIVSEHYFTAMDGVHGAAGSPGIVAGVPISSPLDLLTFCVLTLKNGFTVTGESACASAANFDPDVGRRLARKHAVGKVWPLLGFRLRDKLSAASTEGSADAQG